jgi:hypothetical protein
MMHKDELYQNAKRKQDCDTAIKQNSNIYTPILVCTMSQSEWFTSYLKYKTLEDMLKVILSSSQSVFSYIPMLYHINYNNQEILFIPTGMIGGVIIHYIVQNEKPNKKIIELKRLTGKFSFIDSIGADAQSIYIPILELEKSTLRFPAFDSSSSTS